MDQSSIFQNRGLVPLKNYTGSKAGAGVWQKIISEIPRCEVFVEAMCGSAFISSLVTGCERVINDIDPSVIDKINYPAADVTFRNEDYRAIINRYDNGHKGRVFYFDPPYMLETRRQQIVMYNYDWKFEDHQVFVARLNDMNCPAMVTQYPNDLYDSRLHSWRKLPFTSMTRGGPRTECLYMNFPPAVLLQCPGYVGENFTDRQRINRKVKRFADKLRNLPPKERAAIITALVNEFEYLSGFL